MVCCIGSHKEPGYTLGDAVNVTKGVERHEKLHVAEDVAARVDADDRERRWRTIYSKDDRVGSPQIEGEGGLVQMLRGDSRPLGESLTDDGYAMTTVGFGEIPPCDDLGVSRLTVRFEPPGIARMHADHHGKVVSFRGGHGEQVRLDLRHVLEACGLLYSLLGQDVLVAHHVDVSHGAPRP